MKYQKLCFRCEHRVKFLEKGLRPRFECGETDNAVVGCYMYSPVKPVVLQVNEGDERPPVGPNMITARSHGIGILNCEATVISEDDIFSIYYVPKESMLEVEK